MSKPTYILGLSAFYHDSAACLVKDGQIVAAAQEERFTRKKHDFGFPEHAIRFCLDYAKVAVEELDFVVFYDKPFLKFERILFTYLQYAPFGLPSFLKAMPLWLKEKLFIKDLISDKMGYQGEILFTEHHEAHASSAFFPSPFEQAAVLTMDGVGEWATASYGVGKGNQIDILAEIKFPHSLGLLYSAFTYYTGFRVNSGEYKLMGLAPYGEPKYVDLIKRELIDIKPDGSLRLNLKYFNYCAGLTMTHERFHKLFGAPPRKPESPLTQFYMDVARSIQEVTEEVMLKMARHVHAATGQENLCLAGGVTLNCVGNGQILREGPFKNIWIQPAAGDAGGALGAALFVWHQYMNNPRQADGIYDRQQGSYLGPAFDDQTIIQTAQRLGAVYGEVSQDEIPQIIAELISRQKIVGILQGRMEFGPRALGARSILGDARSQEMQSIMNLKIKFRESFRPFAPSVLEEKAQEYFALNVPSPYMLLVAQVHDGKILAESRQAQASGIEKLHVKRSCIPAVTHVDYSARLQTVSNEQHPLYHEIIRRFYQLTGCPVVINTSFNIRGEPIVCTPEDAYRCFMSTDMDYLVMGRYVFDKTTQPHQGKYKKEDISQQLD